MANISHLLHNKNKMTQFQIAHIPILHKPYLRNNNLLYVIS